MSASGPTGPEWILEVAGAQPEGDLRELMECARRLWPRLKSFARHALTLETSSDEKDRFITEVFEGVLVSARKTLRNATVPIEDLDAYVATVAGFSERLERLRNIKRCLGGQAKILALATFVGVPPSCQSVCRVWLVKIADADLQPGTLKSRVILVKFASSVSVCQRLGCGRYLSDSLCNTSETADPRSKCLAGGSLSD
jgi:hypothetical protein